MTGRSAELSDVLIKRKIDACCVQETKWKGAKSRHIGNGFKLIYNGTVASKNGVGVILSEELTNRLVNVERVSDRLMLVKIALENQPCFNIISAYAPQTGSADSEKEAFWEDLYNLTNTIPSCESVHLGGDLNGHVGENGNNFERWHGGYGYGTQNNDGMTILQYSSIYDLAIINTFFKKKESHLITYKSGGHSTQIDYMLTRRSNLGRYKDCKVIPGEPLTTQHRLMVAVYRLSKPINLKRKLIPKIKWRAIAEPPGELFIKDLKDYLCNDDVKTCTANEIWERFEKVCITTAEKYLGRTRSRKGPNKETQWWSSDIKEVISAKKDAFKLWQSTQDESDRKAYKEKKKEAKRHVASAMAKSNSKFYERLETANTDVNIHKIAKMRHNNTQDLTTVKYINDKASHLLTQDEDIKNRWTEYYKELLNISRPRNQTFHPKPVQGPIPAIEPQEVEKAIKQMKNNKAPGPDEIPAEVWKHMGEQGILWLYELFNKFIEVGAIPNSWRNSFLIPFYKGKGDVRECSNYRAIKLMAHTMKIWERVINNRLNAIITLTPNQCGFVAQKGTPDAIQTIRIMLEKTKANHKNLHMIFIDLEKAFDHIPRDLIWEALRQQLVPERYVSLIQDMYRSVTTQVQSPAGIGSKFELEVGVHQGSTLSPLLFNTTLDYLTKHCQKPLPWNILYADDVVLMSDDANELQNNFNSWVETLENNGLRISRTKTEHMSCIFDSTTNPNSIKFTIGTSPLPTVAKFKYLGSVVSNDAKIENDVTHRTSCGWMKWRQLTGVMCDRKMPIKTKGHVYKTAIRPAMMYGSECWATTKKHLNTLHTAEMRMLRWSAGVTKLDKVRNEHIRGSFKIAPIADKVKENRLRWYGHIQRRPDDHMVKLALNLPTTKRGRGRPPATWLTTVENDLKEASLDASTAQDRAQWRRRIRRADPK